MDRTKLGVYQLQRLLGRGGMGSVYLAHDPRLSREVALKVLSPALANAPGFRERFVAEARSCSRLNHPNITVIHEIGQADGLDFIAFEYVEGENLETMLAREGKLSPERVIEIALPLASAVAHAHARGVVHRDLKPANVVVSTLGVPKILDFGLAKALPIAVSSEGDTLARLTQAGMIVGTIAYMAPEQALGETVDERSDVFSFGCLLYEMLVGRPAFRGATPTQVLDQLLHGEPEPVPIASPEASPALAGIVARSMRKPAEERYQTMEVLASELRAASVPSDSASTTMGSGWAKLWRPAAVVLALVLAFVVGHSWIGSWSGDEPSRGSIAVMYFENLSDPEDSDHVARMLTELLTSEVAAAPDLSVLSRQKLYDVARELGLDGEVDRGVATEVAEAASVGTMVVGRVATEGERVIASVDLVNVSTGAAFSSERAQVASLSDIFELSQSLGTGVREDLLRRSGRAGGAGTSEATGDRLSELTTSVEAYRHYVDGEVALHGSDLEGALDELQEAVRLDPSFALAQFRLSMTARYLSDGPVAHQAARRAVANLERAPRELRDVIQANALYQDGAYSQALPLLEKFVENPDDPGEPAKKEALYLLGQIYVHSLRDGDNARAIDVLERLLTLDPEFSQVYDRLALSYAFRGDLDGARAKLTDWEKVSPEKVEGLRSILATFEGQPEEALGFSQAFSWIEGPLFQTAAALMASRWDAARSLVEQDPDDWHSDQLRAWALRNRAVLHTYLGEFDLAAESYRQAGMATGLRTHEGASGGVPASALQLLAELYSMEGETGAARSEAERALRIQPESWRGLYYAGRMALLDSDLEQGERYLERLRQIPATSTSEAARVYLFALEGEVALASGEPERAKERFVEATKGSMMLDWASTCSSAGASIREGLVRAQLALGDERGATETLETILVSGAERVDHPVVYAESLYRLGVLKLAAGRVEEGHELLARFLSLWGEADRELPSVADARKRLSP